MIILKKPTHVERRTLQKIADMNKTKQKKLAEIRNVEDFFDLAFVSQRKSKKKKRTNE